MELNVTNETKRQIRAGNTYTLPAGTTNRSAAPMPGAFDRRGAAAYLSISTRLLDDLATAGTIKRLKCGRKSLFRRIDLDEYLERLAKEVV